MVSQQGCDGSRYRFGRPWIEAVFWLWVGFFDTISARPLIQEYLSIESKNLEPVSGSRSENQFLRASSEACSARLRLILTRFEGEAEEGCGDIL